MTSFGNETGVITLRRTADIVGPSQDAGRVDDDATRLAREMGSLAQYLHVRHPTVPLSTITTMVEHEHARLAPSKVQSFRMILTQRAVQRRLAPGAHQVPSTNAGPTETSVP